MRKKSELQAPEKACNYLKQLLQTFPSVNSFVKGEESIPIELNPSLKGYIQNFPSKRSRNAL